MKHLTLEEARSALEGLRPVVAQMVAARRRLAAAARALDELRRAIRGNGGVDPGSLAVAERERDERAAEVARCVEAIHEQGALVKDLDAGLVDFPTRHPATGETVLLCWRLGEDEIAHWHGLDEGFAGRKPLPF